MASYQQAPAYNTYQTSPYALPTQQIVQALSTRQSYWDSAASNLKSAYQNYLGLDLSREDNHNKLNQLMEGVNQNLKKATQTDLSIGENYGRAMTIFDPITHDDNIMGDHAITSWYKGQMQVAQDLRTKNGGKEYSDTNVRYMMKGLEDFTKDPSSGNWREHYSTRRSYNPYYDYSPELTKLYKDWKPSAMSSTVPDIVTDKDGKPLKNAEGFPIESGYMKMITDKSTSSAQYRAYLDSNLSSKAKQQLAIEGRVKYGDNLDSLAQDFGRHNSNQIEGYSNYVKQLEGEKLNAKGTDVEVYDHAINDYNGRIQDLKTQNAKLAVGDYSYLKDNKDAIAGNIYTENFVDNVANSAQRKDLTVKYSSNQTYINMYDQNQQNLKLERTLGQRALEEEANRNIKLYGLQLRYGSGQAGSAQTASGGAGLGDATYNTATESNQKEFGQDRYNQLLKDSQVAFDKASDVLTQAISTDLNLDPNKTDKIKWEAAKNGWIVDHPNDKAYTDFVVAADRKKVDDAVFKAMNEFVDKEIATHNPELIRGKDQILNTITQGETIVGINRKGGYGFFTTSREELNLTPEEIKTILSGTNPNLTIKDTVGPAGNTTPTLVKNGKEYDIPYGSKLLNLREQIGTNVDKYQAKRNEILNQKVTGLLGIRRIFGDEKIPWIADTKNIVLAEISGGNSGIITPTDLKLTKIDNQGGIFFKVMGDPKINQKEVAEKIRAQGGQFIKEDDEYYLPPKEFGSLTTPQTYNDSRLQNVQNLVNLESFNKPIGRFNTPDMRFGKRNFRFDVMVDNGRPVYLIQHMESGAKWGAGKNDTPFNTLEEAASAAETLGNLPKDQFEDNVRVYRKIKGYKEN